MRDVTLILSKIAKGDATTAEELLPLVYAELRELAAARMAGERPDQTLQATALVHEAYLRLVDSGQKQNWDGRAHFFAAAGEAMRRILVERARKRSRQQKIRESMTPLAAMDRPSALTPLELLSLDEAICRLESANRQAAEIVKLRFFAGMTVENAAEALGMSARSAHRQWTFARAWLHRELDNTK